MGLDDAFGEIASVLFIVFYILVLLTAAVFGYQIQTADSFRQHVNYNIERRGGLTEQSMKEINQMSKENYNNWYTVTSEKAGQKVSFGETVDYKIEASYPVLFISGLPTIKSQMTGQAVSQVR